MSFNDLVDGCVECRPDSEKLSAIVTLLERQAGSTSSASYSQNEVTINAEDNVEVLATAAAGVTYRQVVIQNRSIYPVAVKYGTGAAISCANGELVLAAGYVSNDGTGGVLTVEGYLGAITAACADVANISVVVVQ